MGLKQATKKGIKAQEDYPAAKKNSGKQREQQKRVVRQQK